MKKNKSKNIFSILLALSISTSSLYSPIGIANAQNNIYDLNQDKVDINLKKALENKDNVEFIVKMKEQKENLNQNSSNVEVVQELLDTAQDTQENIIKDIEEQIKDDNVKDYKSFYIVNSIAVKGNNQAVEELSKRDDVDKIVLNEAISDKGEKLGREKEGEEYKLNSEESSKHVPWNLKAISADKTLAENYKGKGVVVGIIDSGVDAKHPSIANAYRGREEGKAIYSFFDTTTGEKGGEPTDGTGHGTHVAGTILGVDPTGESYLGIAPEAKWIAAKVFDSDGETSLKQLLEAGEWMLAPTDEHGNPNPSMAPRVVNNSWGGKSDNEFFRDILKKWRAAGIVPVFSSGNVGFANQGGKGSIGTPASYPESFAVGAVRQDDKIAAFSLRGPSKYKDDIKPDIVAPGVNIKSSIPGGAYAIRTGTSMAGPHVSGVAALVVGVNPNLTVDEIEKVLTDSATPLKDAEHVSTPNFAYGYGKVNAYKAVKLAENFKGDSKENNGQGTLKGKLLVKGKDSSDPIIEHSPIKSMYRGRPFDIQVKVKDDTYVKNAKLFFSKEDGKWEEKDFKLDLGSKQKGEYFVTINPTELNKDKVKYYIEVEDGYGKKTKTEEYNVEVKDSIGIGYSQDFEDNIDGFEFGGKTPMWEWGEPTSGPNLAKSGKKVLGTKLDGNYDKLKDTLVVLPTIDLTNENRNAALTFNHWYDLDNGDGAFFDTAEVWIGEVKEGVTSTEDIDYKNLRLYKNKSRDWKEEYIDLSSYKGKKISIMLGVRWAGWSKRETSGWYIDDIKIEEASKEVPKSPEKYLSLDFKTDKLVYNFSPIDNPKITAYNLYRSKNPNGPFEKVLTEDISKVGKYSVDLVDIPEEKTGTYYYYATASIGENESNPSEIKSYTYTEGKEVIKYDFEKDGQGWVSIPDSSGNIWTRGKPNEVKTLSESLTGSMPSLDQSRGKNTNSPNVWATELNDFRKPNAIYTLESPSMDLSKLTKARLYMQTWFNTRGRIGNDEYGIYNNDRGQIMISNDEGKTWSTLFELDDKTINEQIELNGRKIDKRAVGAWYTDYFDIPSEYLGKSGIKLKFVLKTGTDDHDIYSGGWYIDDVAIYNLEDAEIQPETARVFEDSKFHLYNDISLDAGNSSTIPVEKNGKLTIEETGVSVYSEEGSGDYELIHPSGEYTAVATAEGYANKREKVIIKNGEITNKDIILEKNADTKININVKDSSGNKVENAVIRLYDNSKNESVYKFLKSSLKGEIVKVGDYKLVVTADGYRKLVKEIKLSADKEFNDDIILNKLLKSEIKELSKDDGTPESGLITLKDNKNVAVKFNVTKDSIIEKVKLMFANKNNSSIGKKFKISIYDKNDMDGLPGDILLEPFEVTVEKEGDWQEVELPENITVNGDFFVSYTQIGDSAKEAALAIDETTKGLGNSFKMHNGAWNEPNETGSFMIRALVSEIKHADKEIEDNSGLGNGDKPTPDNGVSGDKPTPDNEGSGDKPIPGNEGNGDKPTPDNGVSGDKPTQDQSEIDNNSGSSLTNKSGILGKRVVYTGIDQNSEQTDSNKSSKSIKKVLSGTGLLQSNIYIYIILINILSLFIILLIRNKKNN